MESREVIARLRTLRGDIDQAFADIARKHGLTSLAMGKATYDREGSFSFKCDGLFPGGKSREAQAYEVLAKFQKLPPLGTSFVYPRLGACEITGANSTGSKVIIRAAGGKVYLVPVGWIERNVPVDAPQAAEAEPA